MSTDELSQRHVSSDKSIVTPSDFLSDRLNLLNKLLTSLEKEITSYYNKFNCSLHTIPGVGLIVAATILAEIGDIHI